MGWDDFVNVSLLSHPYNWIIVVIILAISTFALCLLTGQGGKIGGLVSVV